MTEIRAYQNEDLAQLTQLINLHISMLIATWELPAELISSRLEINPDQPLLDPWVIERKTFCAFVGAKLVAAAHLLHYGSHEEVTPDYRNTGDIAWFVAYPEEITEAETLLTQCHEQMMQWQVKSVGVWDSGLAMPCATGVSDKWPHLRDLFEQAAYRPNLSHQEAVFSGDFSAIGAPEKPDIPDLRLEIDFGKTIGLKAFVEDKLLGQAWLTTDLSAYGTIPALVDWAELDYLEIEQEWHRRGIGRWLIQEAVVLLKERGHKQIIFAVVSEDEIAGAGAFYNSLGWKVISRGRDGLSLEGWPHEETSQIT